MIEQEKVELIVMLCCVKENGQTKCDQYWPLDVQQNFTFEELCITLSSVESIMPNLIKRKL